MSAGCEMMAEATPAMTPEASESETFHDDDDFSGVVFVAPYLPKVARARAHVAARDCRA